MSDRDRHQADELRRRAGVVLVAIDKAPDETAKLAILVDFYQSAGREMVDEILRRMKEAAGTVEASR